MGDTTKREKIPWAEASKNLHAFLEKYPKAISAALDSAYLAGLEECASPDLPAETAVGEWKKEFERISVQYNLGAKQKLALGAFIHNEKETSRREAYAEIAEEKKKGALLPKTLSIEIEIRDENDHIEGLRQVFTFELMKAGGISRKLFDQVAGKFVTGSKIYQSLLQLPQEKKEETKPEKPIEPHPCSTPNLDQDCTGCTDRHSEGTHQGCTKQHGHIGCNLAEKGDI